MKDKIISIFKHKNTVVIVSVLLVASVVANVYFLAQPVLAPSTESKPREVAKRTAVIDSPYGFKNEVVTVYDGKQTKTYATTTPITEEDVKEMRENVIRHQKMMDEYFRKQDELFRSFWYAL
ncbi:MAG TPA: hypothetical protein PKA42_02610 [Candidatus Paceibacterota bacterium]|nr:hypothetical protein [Candidatus Paceibacterota bacterium]HMO83036.1 hypothetical protein [Candidatus Paceibacterota bacterium]